MPPGVSSQCSFGCASSLLGSISAIDWLATTVIVPGWSRTAAQQLHCQPVLATAAAAGLGKAKNNRHNKVVHCMLWQGCAQTLCSAPDVSAVM